jgi:PAS domain S-box-containing protein
MGCTEFSESWLAFAGRPVEQEVGYGWADRVHPDDLPHCLDIYQSAFAGRHEFLMRYRLQRYDGDYRWILDIGTPEWDRDGRFLGYVGSCVDVTEAHRVGSDVAAEDPSALEITRGDPLEPLTTRERDVAVLLARGLANHEIADELVISVYTVRVHVEHILDKLGLHSRAQVAAWMVRHIPPRRAAAHREDRFPI